MLAELGQVALVLALMVALLQALLPLLGAQRGIAPLMAIARPAAFLQFALVAPLVQSVPWGRAAPRWSRWRSRSSPTVS